MARFDLPDTCCYCTLHETGLIVGKISVLKSKGQLLLEDVLAPFDYHWGAHKELWTKLYVRTTGYHVRLAAPVPQPLIYGNLARYPRIEFSTEREWQLKPSEQPYPRATPVSPTQRSRRYIG